MPELVTVVFSIAGVLREREATITAADFSAGG